MKYAYRRGHSTETTVTKVLGLSDILIAIHIGNFDALALLDLTAAFDMVDHRFFCKHCRVVSASLVGHWREYDPTFNTGRTMLVLVAAVPAFGRSQAACRGVRSGPILFLIYTADLPRVIKRRGFQLHLFADATCDQPVAGSNPAPGSVAQQPWASCSHLRASVAKQYNLVPAKGR